MSDDTDIANAFRDSFIQSTQFNTSDISNETELDDFKAVFNKYKGNVSITPVISSEMIDFIVLNKGKKGKSTDCDNLFYEHFIYCHPIVICIIAKLFNLILELGVVPQPFGTGFIVPIPKGDKRSHRNVEDYRGIAWCNVMSKIFEHCLLMMCEKFLVCSERQFLVLKRNLVVLRQFMF